MSLVPEYDPRSVAAARDTYLVDYSAPSQSGANDVLTFDLDGIADLIWVRSVGGISYARVTGVPANGDGIYLADDEPHPITCRTSTLSVWAPVGATVFVWAYG